MKTYRLDCAQMTTREALHGYLARELALPGYYGKNLDALFDCLTDMDEPAVFYFSHLNELQKLPGDYGRRLWRPSATRRRRRASWS